MNPLSAQGKKIEYPRGITMATEKKKKINLKSFAKKVGINPETRILELKGN